MCSTVRSSSPVAAPRPARRDPGARVGDAERDRTVDVLADAAAEGFLAPDEHGERLSVALQARTRADLDRLTADLPPQWRAARQHVAAAHDARRAARGALRPHLASYAGVMAVLVVVWLVTGVLAGAWYPWPLWPALGWGIGVAGHVRGAYGAPRQLPS
jgi:hypothetical protein